MRLRLFLNPSKPFLNVQRGLWLIALLITAATASAQTIRYVKPGGTGNAGSWATASADLQAVINASAAGDQVWVAGGTYKPGGDANTDQSISFSLKNGVAIYGGFAGMESALIERPASVTLSSPSSSVLSGDLGTLNDRNDNSRRIISNTDLDNTAVLDGFVITAANLSAQSNNNENTGGGMRNVNSSPTIRNCFFTNHTGSFSTLGSGLYGDASSNPSLTNCTFDNNYGQYGGAIYSSRITLLNCTFTNNLGSGGATVIVATAVMTNCTFAGNIGNEGPNGGSSGGAAEVGNGSTLTNCLFTNNISVGFGGALSVSNSTVTNCTFRGNRATSSGAGVPDSYGGAVICGGTTFINCSFSNNQVNGRRQSGGGAVSAGSGSAFINCSFARNTCNQPGGAVSGNGVSFVNCIVWGNTPNGVNASTIAAITYTDTQDGTPGTDNLSADPLFVDAAGDNLRLQACSPAIDRGNSSANPQPTDLDGNARQVRTIDMGAYEFKGTPLSLVAITQQPASFYSIPQGGTLTASVSVTGSVTGYQWYKQTPSGTPVALTGVTSATTATLTLANLTPADSGRYVVVVTGGCNSATSASFTLVVNTGMYSVKTGSWTDASVWSLNRVPIGSDAVRLKHVVIIPASYEARAQSVSYDPAQRLQFGPAGRLKLGP